MAQRKRKVDQLGKCSEPPSKTRRLIRGRVVTTTHIRGQTMDEEMEDQAGNNEPTVKPYCELPRRPDETTSMYEIPNYCGTYDAASWVQERWLDWSYDAEDNLDVIADELLRVDVPEPIMLGLLQRVERLPAKPGVPMVDRYIDDEDTQRYKVHTQRHIHQDWAEWANEFQHLCDDVMKVRDRYDLRRKGSSCDDLLEGIDFGRLSLSRSMLQRRDLRRDFLDMVRSASSRQPDITMNEQRKLKVLLKVIFEGEEKAKNMTDAQAEDVVAQLEKVDLNDDPDVDAIMMAELEAELEAALGPLDNDDITESVNSTVVEQI